MRPSLDVLKKGLATLKDHIKTRKDGLLARLARKEKISDADTAWFDRGAANHVDEDRVVEKLETASDYGRGFGRLDVKELGLVESLKQLAEGADKSAVNVAPKKRKSVCVCFWGVAQIDRNPNIHFSRRKKMRPWHRGLKS
jgi:hypothetical protein